MAEALKAVKLMFITPHDGILVQGRLVRQMLLADFESVLALQKNDIAPELLSKALHAVSASSPARATRAPERALIEAQPQTLPHRDVPRLPARVHLDLQHHRAR